MIKAGMALLALGLTGSFSAVPPRVLTTHARLGNPIVYAAVIDGQGNYVAYVDGAGEENGPWNELGKMQITDRSTNQLRYLRIRLEAP